MEKWFIENDEFVVELPQYRLSIISGNTVVLPESSNDRRCSDRHSVQAESAISDIQEESAVAETSAFIK